MASQRMAARPPAGLRNEKLNGPTPHFVMPCCNGDSRQLLCILPHRSVLSGGAGHRGCKTGMGLCWTGRSMWPSMSPSRSAHRCMASRFGDLTPSGLGQCHFPSGLPPGRESDTLPPCTLLRMSRCIEEQTRHGGRCRGQRRGTRKLPSAAEGRGPCGGLWELPSCEGPSKNGTFSQHRTEHRIRSTRCNASIGPSHGQEPGPPGSFLRKQQDISAVASFPGEDSAELDTLVSAESDTEDSAQVDTILRKQAGSFPRAKSLNALPSDTWHLPEVKPSPLPRLGVLDRYLLQQLAAPFFLSLLTITCLALSIATAHELSAVSQTRWPLLWKATCSGVLWAYRMPFYAGLAVPMAALLSSLLGLGALGGRCETVALQACGVGPTRVAFLIACAFLGVALAHLTISEAVTPVANKRAAAVVRFVRAQKGKLPMYSHGRFLKYLRDGVARGPTVRQAVVVPEFRDGRLRRLFYAHSCRGGVMGCPTVVQLEKPPKGSPASTSASSTPPIPSSGALEGVPAVTSSVVAKGTTAPALIVTAEEASWDQAASTWRFVEGSRYTLGSQPADERGRPPMTDEEAAEETAAALAIESPIIGPLPVWQRSAVPDGEINSNVGKHLPDDSLAPGGQARDVLTSPVDHSKENPPSPAPAAPSPVPILKSWSSFPLLRVDGLTRLPLDMADKGLGRSLDDLSIGEMRTIQRLLRRSCNHKESLNVQVKLQQRLALPWASPVFAALGALSSLCLPHHQSQLGFAVALLLIFLYYTASVAGALLAQLQVLQPVLAAWLPNVVGAALVLWLLLVRRGLWRERGYTSEGA